MFICLRHAQYNICNKSSNWITYPLFCIFVTMMAVEPRKIPNYFELYWLFHRDHYNGILQPPYKCIGCHPLYIPLNSQGPFVHCSFVPLLPSWCLKALVVLSISFPGSVGYVSCHHKWLRPVTQTQTEIVGAHIAHNSHLIQQYVELRFVCWVVGNKHEHITQMVMKMVISPW